MVFLRFALRILKQFSCIPFSWLSDYEAHWNQSVALSACYYFSYHGNLIARVILREWQRGKLNFGADAITLPSPATHFAKVKKCDAINQAKCYIFLYEILLCSAAHLHLLENLLLAVHLSFCIPAPYSAPPVSPAGLPVREFFAPVLVEAI